MRLLFLTNFYPPYDMGGFEQWCHEVAVQLKDRGHQIVILTSRFGLNSNSQQEEDVIRSLFLQADIYYYSAADFFLKHRKLERANKTELKRVIDQYKPDLIVIWGMWNLSHQLAYLAEEIMPGRVAYYFAGYWPIDQDVHEVYWMTPARRSFTEFVKRPLKSIAMAQLHREDNRSKLKFEQTMCCSQYVRDTLVNSGRLPNNTGVLFGGIDPNPFIIDSIDHSRSHQVLRLVYFGGMYPRKGVNTAIEALGILKEMNLLDQVELTLIGRGHPGYEAHLHELARNLGLDGRAQFADWVPRQEVPSRLRNFDAYLFTSNYPEPMARTVMEAMAAGLLVIGSEAGGQKEMFCNGINSLTFQPGDAPGLANQIRRVLEDPTLKNRIAQAGRQMVLERFTLSRMVEDMEKWWMDILFSQKR